ncbi:hypothetical protein CsatA_015895 [Cannabis sativa]
MFHLPFGDSSCFSPVLLLFRDSCWILKTNQLGLERGESCTVVYDESVSLDRDLFLKKNILLDITLPPIY